MLRLLILALPLLIFVGQARADAWPSQWRAAIRSGDLTALSKLAAPDRDVDLADRRGRTALMVATSKGEIPLMRRLLDLGAEVDKRNAGGGTALMFAAQYDRGAAARLLLNHGAKTDIQAAKGWAALMIASLKGSDDVIEALLENGADPNLRDYQGFTPLMRAVAENREGAVRLLLGSNRIQVNAADERGISALHLGAAAGRTEIVRMLLLAGADRDQRDQEANTPQSLAEGAGHDSVLRLLKTWPQ